MDLAASGVAYKERLNQPVIPMEVEMQQPEALRPYFQGQAQVLPRRVDEFSTGNRPDLSEGGREVKVKVVERHNPNAFMSGEYDKQIVDSNGGELVEHNLKVHRCATSDVLFSDLSYREFQSLSLGGGNYVDFYYTGRDGAGYLFSTRP